jgi:D-alanine-D-alanine ligase
MNKPNIAVLAGGYSGEYDISIQSAAEILEHIDTSRFSPIIVILESEESWWVVHSDGRRSNIDKSNFTWLNSSGDTQTFDVAFIMVHGTPGEDGLLQKYFENLNIPFTTGSSDSVSTTFNKYLTNNKLRKEGLLVAKSYLIEKGNLLGQDELNNILNLIPLPCFIKPNHGGSSLGVTKVLTKEDILPSIYNAFKTGTPSVLIESLLIGKEFSVGVVPGDDSSPIAMPITEIISENEFFDYEAKYEGASQEITPAEISNELADKIQLNALQAYESLNCRGMVRVDFIVVEENRPAILEINSVPGFTKMSLLPQQLAHARINVRDLLSRIIESSIAN